MKPQYVKYKYKHQIASTRMMTGCSVSDRLDNIVSSACKGEFELSLEYKLLSLLKNLQ